MAITLFSEDPSNPSSEDQKRTLVEPPPDLLQRVQRLEDDVTELRSVVTRFADVVVGEVKEMHEKSAAIAAIGHSIPINAPGMVTETGAVVSHPTTTRRRWLLTDCVRDLRTTFQMYLDPQYRVRRSTQLLVPFIVGLFVFNVVFFSYVFSLPILSTILEKLVDVLLAIILYKVLQQEMERYREAMLHASTWRTPQPTTGDLLMMTTDPAHPPTTRQEME